MRTFRRRRTDAAAARRAKANRARGKGTRRAGAYSRPLRDPGSARSGRDGVGECRADCRLDRTWSQRCQRQTRKPAVDAGLHLPYGAVFSAGQKYVRRSFCRDSLDAIRMAAEDAGASTRIFVMLERAMGQRRSDGLGSEVRVCGERKIVYADLRAMKKSQAHESSAILRRQLTVWSPATLKSCVGAFGAHATSKMFARWPVRAVTEESDDLHGSRDGDSGLPVSIVSVRP